jgi:hypothetical protein
MRKKILVELGVSPVHCRFSSDSKFNAVTQKMPGFAPPAQPSKT